MNYFKQVKAEDGTIVWTHEQDICPDTLYLDSVKTFRFSSYNVVLGKWI
ncbi:MAG: DUF2442 domain-containing protein [Candidatus Delongbacteria bacterium]|nr:DUF2442 domain-containing protein [Candidatus Delongbacteria bacterium]